MPNANIAAEARVSQEYLRSILHYDPETGVFTWLKSRGRQKAGSVAGSTNKETGRVTVIIDRRKIKAHRLAVLYMTGAWPENDVDHKDVDPSNNAWVNLRPATVGQNHQNKKLQTTNFVGLAGVYAPKHTRKFRAEIRTGGKARHLGYFKTPEEAHAAYLAAKQELHPFFIRHTTGVVS